MTSDYKIGCGGTTEDPNISRFLSFSAQYLKTEIPYFYLYRKGDALKDLPDNFIPVCYGDAYSDLSSFLMEIGSYRIRFHSGFDQMMEINPYETISKTASAFGRMHFMNRFNKFIGREKEMACLKSFCKKPEQVLFWSVIGEGGIGKSRLLLEFLTGIDSEWFGFFGRKGSDTYENLVPFSNTVVVFDYIVGEEEKCAAAIRTLIRKFESSAFKLRIVFLERKIEKESQNWFHTLQKSFDASTRIIFDRTQYSSEPLTLNGVKKDWDKAVMYYELFPEDADIAHAVAELSRIYMRFLTKKKLFKRAGKITEQMEKVSKRVPDDETVGKYAICLSNIYGMNSIGMKECSPNASNEARYEALGILEELFKKYPDNQDVAQSYGVAKSDSYFDKSSAELDLTEEQIKWYREQFEQNKDNVEFAESYARILGLQAEKVFRSGDEKRAYDILNEIRRIGKEADLHEYEDEDANIFIETADGVDEIFRLRKFLDGKF